MHCASVAASTSSVGGFPTVEAHWVGVIRDARNSCDNNVQISESYDSGSLL